jgi:hypothetical protein
VEEHIELTKVNCAFYFVFRLYNFVLLAIEDNNCRNISVLVIKGTVSCFVWLPCLVIYRVTEYTGFICASAIGYYITILEVDTRGRFIFRQ